MLVFSQNSSYVGKECFSNISDVVTLACDPFCCCLSISRVLGVFQTDFVLVISSPVSVDDLKRAIIQADMDIDGPKMEKYIKWVFNSETPYETEPLDVSKVGERLQKGNVSRSVKKT